MQRVSSQVKHLKPLQNIHSFPKKENSKPTTFCERAVKAIANFLKYMRKNNYNFSNYISTKGPGKGASCLFFIDVLMMGIF